MKAPKETTGGVNEFIRLCLGTLEVKHKGVNKIGLYTI